MHLDIRYITHFVYPTPVWESQNVLRACPLDTPDQQLLSYDLSVRPDAVVHSYVDRWGTRVDNFGVVDEHDELVVTVTASVETSEPRSPSPVDLEDLRAETSSGGHWLYLQYSGHTQWDDQLASVAAGAVEGAKTVNDAATAIEGIVHERLEYVPGSTSVGVSPTAVWSQGGGVCQDFAHLMIAMLRSQLIPARYVSGYFYAADPSVGTAPDASEITVQTHAWVEVYLPGFGWWGVDPTNRLETGERHVIIGRGRDYDDVLPMRGVYYGDSDHALATEVVMSVSGLGPVEIPPVPGARLAAQQ